MSAIDQYEIDPKLDLVLERTVDVTPEAGEEPAGETPPQ